MAGNGLGDTSSNPGHGCQRFASLLYLHGNILEKSFNQSILSLQPSEPMEKPFFPTSCGLNCTTTVLLQG